MTVEVPALLTEAEVADVDALVASGRFADRSEVLRTALAKLLREEREREIDEAYRRGYSKYPQEEWIGEAGLAFLDEWSRTEGGDPL